MGYNVIRSTVVDVKVTNDFYHFIDNGRVIHVNRARPINNAYKRASQKIRRLK
ncbi:MAG: hypothetical protein GOVbin655_2 [Prokaryotic dsDNA virus sp.]|nr:MAG: hypothetical protein GOVbin655_2 [Prokaryotic dsDNA virus sp.]